MFLNNICVRWWQDKDRTKALNPGHGLRLQLFQVSLANRSPDSTGNSFVDLCRFIWENTSIARLCYQLLLKKHLWGFTAPCTLAESSRTIQFYRTPLNGIPNLQFFLCLYSPSSSPKLSCHFNVFSSVFHFEGQAWLEYVTSSPTDGVHL